MAMLFDQPPSELPVATVRSRGITAVATALRCWLSARWQWFRPRTVPVMVAVLGTIALAGSASYLSNLAHQPTERVAAPTLLMHQQDVAQLRP
ncbi:MAG: hypothetical protein H6Q90_1341 [Deltaproteobacteria bacterium]|nr:hypothetical protein [Deltaproteobacteria bacterium]